MALNLNLRQRQKKHHKYLLMYKPQCPSSVAPVIAPAIVVPAISVTA